MPGTDHIDVLRSRFGTTTAGEVDSVTFAANYAAADVVVKSPAGGSTGLFVTGDGSAPDADGDDVDWVPPVLGAFVRVPLGSSDVVKVYSDAADGYVVRGVVDGYGRGGGAGVADGGTP